MYRVNIIIFHSIILFLLTTLPVQAGWFPWSPSNLLSIDGEEYSTEDFKNWWENFQEKGMKFPESPTPFVDWNLLFKEAERMKLYESPGYRKNAITFLKARTLMQLKSEEVDKKITISDAALWDLYLEKYTPQYQLHTFFFKRKEAAQVFVDKFDSEPLSNEAFAARHERDDGYYYQVNEWYRPVTINPGWLPLLHEIEIGTMSQPIPWKEDFVVLRLQDKVEETQEDFRSVKEHLQKTIWKTEENRLTADLLNRLRKQYQVTIDNERLEQLDIRGPDKDFSDEPIIFTSNGNISEKLVVAKIRQIQRFRDKNGFKEDISFQFKNQVVNGIIDQTLTSWEALARKYEQKPPFEAIYKFYCQHRMVKLFEERLFSTKVTVSQEEIESYYQTNIALFSEPEVIRMVIVEGSVEGLNALWLEVALGGDFRLLAEQSTGQEIPVQDVPVNHLNPKVKEILDTLTVNEVSQVFTVDGHVTLVQLIKRKAAYVKPLSGEVKESIRTNLHTAKLQRLRQEYLEKLRVEYAVEINESVWQNLKKELEQPDETN